MRVIHAPMLRITDDDGTVEQTPAPRRRMAGLLYALMAAPAIAAVVWARTRPGWAWTALALAVAAYLTVVPTVAVVAQWAAGRPVPAQMHAPLLALMALGVVVAVGLHRQERWSLLAPAALGAFILVRAATWDGPAASTALSALLAAVYLTAALRLRPTAPSPAGRSAGGRAAPRTGGAPAPSPPIGTAAGGRGGSTPPAP